LFSISQLEQCEPVAMRFAVARGRLVVMGNAVIAATAAITKYAVIRVIGAAPTQAPGTRTVVPTAKRVVIRRVVTGQPRSAATT